MVKPESKFLWITTENELSLKPNKAAMKKVYNSFKRNGINLHIDCGSDSEDFVTGKKWGNLSQADIIPYEEIFETDDGYDHWKSVINQHFNQARRKVFHHCIFLNQFHYKQDGKDHYTSSGLSMDIPGQCFIVANQSWLREKGNYGVAGTFMHELGHNLGLYHGGFNSNNEPDYSTNYKPNHLSVMNYLYQTSGLLTIMPSDSLKLDYSQVSLPDLNENYLLEANGIDPYGNTSSWLYRCIIQYANALGDIKSIKLGLIASISVDFNRNDQIDQEPVVADINHDGKKNILQNTTPEWPRLDYTGGAISGGNVFSAGVENETKNSEFSLQDALERDLLAEEGNHYSNS